MGKSQEVQEEIGRRFREERGRRFTAGEVARRAGVCRNTAKKYLVAALYEDDSPLRVTNYQLANGLIADVWFFVQYEV